MKKNTLKKLVLGTTLGLLCNFVNAQGLENLIVEKYYVSDANDAAGSVGVVPVGSVTYRIFVDMLPGYKYQALYGATYISAPAHIQTLSISTTTTFFNNEDRGATTPTYTKVQASHNSVMLDSWFTAGATCTNQWGVMKTDDNGVSTIVNTDGILQNNDPTAGTPLTSQDGMIAVSGTHTPGAVTFVGITSGPQPTGWDTFDNLSQVGSTFSTDNGSIACLGGVYGPDSLVNKVLIGQFTTDGIFCFNLNLQLGTPSGGTETYVAQNAVGTEIQNPNLSFCSNTVDVPQINVAKESSLRVYPNPVNELFNIDIYSSEKSEVNSYKVIDILGNQLVEKNIGSIFGKYSEKVDVSSFSKGIYFVEFNLNGLKSTKKIIKY